MQHTPDAGELVTAVREFLEAKILPSLEGHTAFHARVAVNVLATVERELIQGPEARAREDAGLEGLLAPLGSGEALSGPAGTQALAQAIREGRIDLQDPDLTRHLWQSVIDRVAIDQPSYSGLRDALQILEAARQEELPPEPFKDPS